MAKRLVKIAKELNVGTTTIVEHLTKRGFDIENKPTAKVSEEMLEELLKEFQGSVDIKSQADSLVIGNRPSKKEELEAEEAERQKNAAPKVETPPPPPPVVEPDPEPVVEEIPVEEVPVEEVPVAETSIEEETSPRVGLNIKGKIDLNEVNKKPKKKKKEKKEPEVVKEPEEEVVEEVEEVIEEIVSEEVVVETEEAASDVEEPSEPTKAPNEMIRAKTPQLKGLKILGKVDPDKLKKKKKKKDPPKKDATKKDGKTTSEDDKRKRRRKRKKVPTQGRGNSTSRPRPSQGGGGNRRPARVVKEVSQKEIDDKIKATMARLSGGGKKKRQKLRRDNRERIREKQELEAAEKEITQLQLTEFVSVSELASLMDVSVTEVITTCMNLGVIVSINQRLDAEIIELVAEEFGHEVEFINAEEADIEEEEIIDDPADLLPRAPVVAVMGHVDHGKTSLLDYIRSAKVADDEAGGITQHIGAYEVEVGDENKRIVFLDTPGHEAFTAMRARGAKVTDIAIVIVSADDSVMPQTKEAISHAQAAGVPIVFAINKIDKEGANPERIKTELASMNLLVEEWGGKYQSQDLSAKVGTNVDLLLEKVLLEAEMLELKSNPDRMTIGTVIEASLDKGRGFVTKILVQHGTLNIGDPIVAGEHSGKIKAMFNERGQKLKTAGPSTPVLILGLSGAPQAGEKFKETETEQEARQIASKRAQIVREQTNRASKRISLDEIGRRLALGTFKELNLIIKGDVDGSIEALADSLIKLSVETIQVNVIHKAVGQIIESDILLASASDAIIIGFQVRPSIGARKLAEREGVEVKTYSIIYEAIEEIKAAMEGMLEPTKEEKITSQVEVRETYKISRIGTIAGCYVLEGKIARSSFIRVIRDGIVVYPTKEGVTGEISSLKRFKEDVKEVKNGMECGLTVKNYNDIKNGDIIEAYEIVEIKQTLE